MSSVDTWNILEADQTPLAESPHFGSSQIAIRASQEKERSRYQAVIASPVAMEDFLDVLNKISPMPERVSYAVVADWEMPDEADNESLRLQEIHWNGLGEFWRLFNSHRQKFLEALHSVDSVFREYYYRSAPFVTDEELHDGIFNFVQTKQVLVEFFESLQHTHQEQLHDVLDSWREASRRKRGKRRKPGHNHFAEWDIKHLKGAMNYVTDTDLREEARRISFELRGERFNESKERKFTQAVHPDTGQLLYVSNAQNRDFIPYLKEAIEKKRVEKNGFIGEVSLTEERRRLGTEIRLLENQNLNRSRLFPLLQWSTDRDGTREWNYGRFLPDDFTALQSNLPDALKDGCSSDQLDALLGLITVAGTRIDVTEHWPKRMSLPQGKYEQKVGPAQIPILVAMSERRLLQKNEFLETLEEQI